MRLSLLIFALAAPAAALAQGPNWIVDKPAALVADGIPAVPGELAERTRPYMEFRTASLQGWNPRTRGIAITTRFGNTAQVHEVARPLGMRRQVTFEDFDDFLDRVTDVDLVGDEVPKDPSSPISSPL